MTPPTPPAAAVVRPVGHLRGAVAAWCTPGFPYLEVRLYDATGPRPRTVDIRTGPATCSPTGIADPAELDHCSALLAAAHAWLTDPEAPPVGLGEQTPLFPQPQENPRA